MLGFLKETFLAAAVTLSPPAGAQPQAAQNPQTTQSAAQGLPPLPSYASGIQCSAEDKLDRNNTNFMEEKLRGVIDSGDIYAQGWKIVSRSYATMGAFRHNNFELLDPNGKAFATLDTLQIDNKGKEVGYMPFGDRATPVIDDCKLGNTSVVEGQVKGEIPLAQGTGTQMLAQFARAMEIAKENGQRNYRYQLFPDSDGREANSNSFARSLAFQVFGVDINEKHTGQNFLMAPGLGIDLNQKPYAGSFYKIDPKNSESANSIIHNPQYLKRLLEDMKALHPITQQQESIRLGKPPEAASSRGASRFHLD